MQPRTPRWTSFALATCELAGAASAQCPFEMPAVSRINSPTSLAAADLDGDGRTDFALGQEPQAFSLALQSTHGLYPGDLPFVSTSGTSTRAVRAADMDSDGDVDLVFGAERLLVARNDGAGGFGIIDQYPLPWFSEVLVLVDIDLDGDVDVVTGHAPGSLALRLNDGQGNLAAPIVVSPPGHAPKSIAIGLIDSDAWPDIITGDNQHPAEFALHRGLGGGVFAAPVIFAVGATPTTQHLALGDVTGDGLLDLVYGAVDDIVHVLAGDGAGGFSEVGAYVCDATMVCLALADLDRDGDLDVIGGAQITGSVQIFLNQGAGVLTSATSWTAGAGVKGIACVDVNADGAIDVVVAAAESNGMLILLGDGEGGLRTPQRTSAGVSESGGSIRLLRNADVDLDGRNDLIYLAREDSLSNWRMCVRRGLGGGAFDAATWMDVGPAAAGYVLCQLDSDGVLDVAVLENGAPTLYLGDGAGGFTLSASLTVLAGAVELAAGDITGDGRVDLVVTTQVWCPPPVSCPRFDVGVYAGDGAGGAALPVILTAGPNPTAPVIGDVDGDGLDDLIVFNAGDGTRSLFKQVAPATYVTSISAHGPARASTLADVDGDGVLDLVTLDNAPAAHWRAGDGLGGFGVSQQVGEGGDDVLELADLDGDGDLDLALEVLGRELDFWINDGAGAFTLACSGPAGPGDVATLTALDADQDGRPELAVGTSFYGCGIALHRNAIAAAEPQAYCTAKVNSLGCTPVIGFSGAASARAASGFIVSAGNVRNQKLGLLVYSVSGRAAIPLQGGYLCLAAPRMRSPAKASGGSTIGNDCTGAFSLDMNAFAAGVAGGAPHVAIANVGTRVAAQWWGRDPGAAAGNTTLSNAIEYVVGP